MRPFHEYINEYKKQLEKGDITKAYRGLIEYLMDLRSYLSHHHPDYLVPTSFYYGYMDMSYFSFTPRSLVDRKLKIAIVFIHDRCRFEAWLAGANKQVQLSYWVMFKQSGWAKYHVVPTTKGVDSIVEHILVANPDFGDLDALTSQIEKEALVFIEDIESFLSTLQA